MATEDKVVDCDKVDQALKVRNDMDRAYRYLTSGLLYQTDFKGWRETNSISRAMGMNIVQSGLKELHDLFKSMTMDDLNKFLCDSRRITRM
jgi:hypothetical protein